VEKMLIARVGDTNTLLPGSSVRLPSRLYHKFWGRDGKGTVLAGVNVIAVTLGAGR
jgi:D-lyxose ketol-isomerase